MIQSIIVYSILIGIMLLCAIAAAKKCSYFTSGLVVQQSFWRFDTIFPLFLFAIIFGMRYNVGTDHLAYLEGYLWKEHVSKGEPLFDLLSEISWKLNLHYVVYFSIIAFIQVFFFFYAFKNERYLYPFLVFFLFTDGSVFFWMNGIRQALAMCIWIFSLKYMEEKKFWKYLLCVIIAFLFHRSAIILLLFYPILKNGKDYFNSIPLQIILISLAFIFRTVFTDVIFHFDTIISTYRNILGGDLYSGYNMDTLMNSFRENEGTGLAYLFKIAFNVVIIFYSKEMKNYYKSKRFNIIYFFFFIGLITTYMFPSGAISFTRPFRYFYIFQTILYAYFLYYLSKTKYKSTRKGSIHALLYYSLILVFLGIFYLSQITANENSSTWYQFYFDQDIYGYPSRS